MQETHTNFPNKFEAFYLVAVLIAIEFILALATRQYGLFGDIDWQGRGAMITVIGNGIVFIFLTTYKQLSYRALFHPSDKSLTATLRAPSLPILLMVPGLVSLTAALNLIVLWVWPMSENDMLVFNDMMDPSPIPVISACIGAPLLEEMLFRGVILRSFLTQYSRQTAILWSSLLFGLAHLNAYQFFTGLIIGIVSGWLYERTRSLWPSILLHAAFNSFVVFSVNIDLGGSTAAWLGASFAFSIVGGLWLVRTLEVGVPAAKIDGRS
jgi:membrane protease YdiL (CAAX protease family)